MGTDLSKGSGYKDHHFKVSYLYVHHGLPGKTEKNNSFHNNYKYLGKRLYQEKERSLQKNPQMLLKEIVKNTGKSKKIHVHRSEEKTLLN